MHVGRISMLALRVATGLPTAVVCVWMEERRLTLDYGC